MIRTVLFDVGGVLLRTEDPTPRRALEQRLGLAAGEAEQLVFNGQQGTAAQLGQISSSQLWQWLGEHLALDQEDVESFRTAFFAGDHINRDLIDLVEILRPAYQVAILSNFMDDLRRMLQEEYPIAHLFDPIIISAEEGLMKPAPGIFLRALELLDCAADEVIFIDDFLHNVVGARAVGLHAVHYRPGIELRARLQEAGVQIPS